MTAVREILERLAALGVVPTGVADDSRQVRRGDLFLAYPGDLADGRRYIPDAIGRGAIAVLWEPDGVFAWNPALTATNAPCAGLRALAGPLAHAVYGRPTEKLSLIAVTGTNGKTTVSQFVAQAYPARCAVVGTLGAGFPGKLVETGFTTPEATTLMRLLAEFRQAGAAACALEASSIGIEEGRMNGAQVDVAIFTNFTRDHLDYHGTMEDYAAAKARLFAWSGLRTAIINVDDALGRKLIHSAQAKRVLAYGIGPEALAAGANVVAFDVQATPEGQAFTLALPDGSVAVKTGLLGRYNVSNLLAVAAVLHDAGGKPEDIGWRLQCLTPPAGRMERLGGSGEPLVVVDYAHTPDALENTLLALRPVAAVRGGALRVVFGCGGNRDKGKRPEMGALAERLADSVLLTSDNPRDEDPEAILRDIAAGMRNAVSEPSRARAIAAVIGMASNADVILVAGKGHENYQETAGVRAPFSDVDEARNALDKRGAAGKEGDR